MEWLSNFGMREWLISCGIVLVLVVLLDGFRRMRAERKGEIKMSLRMGGEFPEGTEEELYSTELPNGGARVVGRAEPAITDITEQALVESESDQAAPSGNEQNAGSIAEAETAIERQVSANEVEHSESGLISKSELIVLHAKSQDENGFNGSDLLEVLLACDCRYGERDILHRYERTDGNGQLQFSVANMVEPGTFSLEDISSFRTPGVTFFMSLPGAEDPEDAFNCMLETANCLANNLNASLLDDAHGSLTPATIEDYRSRVSSFMPATA